MENTNTNLRSRCWFFTWNNFPADFSAKIEFADRYIYQVEEGEAGNIHLQGCMYFTNDKTFEQMKDRYPGMHLEKSKWLASRIWYGLKEDTRKDGPFIKGVTDQQLKDAQAEAIGRSKKRALTERELIKKQREEIYKSDKHCHYAKIMGHKGPLNWEAQIDEDVGCKWKYIEEYA